MKGLNIDVSVDVDHVRFPIYFEHKNICVHCGGVGTLKFVNKFGDLLGKEVSAFDHIKCTQCGRVYSMKWDPVEGSDTYRPSAVEFDIKRDFKNFITGKGRKGEKILD